MKFVYLGGHNSPQVHVAICTFKGTIISSGFWGLASVRKGIYLKVAARMPAGWYAVSVVPRRHSDITQPHQLRSASVQLCVCVGGGFCTQGYGESVSGSHG